jgi:hypothetical protein
MAFELLVERQQCLDCCAAFGIAPHQVGVIPIERDLRLRGKRYLHDARAHARLVEQVLTE